MKTIEFLKSLRTALGLTLRDVETKSEQMGFRISNAYLSQMESGKVQDPSLRFMYALSRVYGLSPAKFIEMLVSDLEGDTRIPAEIAQVEPPTTP